MFSWLEGLVSSIASSIGGVFEGIGDTIVNAIWDNLVKWLFNAFYDSIADVFSQMGDMGAEIFDLSWIEAAVHLFFLFGWVLFGVGVIVAAFDLAVEYQNGRANIKSTMLNVLKGFFAATNVTTIPRIISTMESISKSLISCPPFHRFRHAVLCTQRVQAL